MRWDLPFVAVLAVLLFVGGPDSESHRVYQTVWNTGHLVLFTGAALLLLRLPQLKEKAWILQFLVITLFCLVIGFAIEVVQLKVGRSYEMMDVFYDLLGGYVGLLFFTANQLERSLVLRVSLYPIMLVLIIIVLMPVINTVVDEFRIKEEFPLLAEFESDYELTRWDTMLATLSIDKTRARYGNSSLRVDFEPGEYPDITLQHFYGSWRGFESLRFSVYNPTLQNIPMELKIYDRHHISTDYEYTDRFNRELVMKPGWNDFEFSIAEIESAPADRSMNLDEIKSFSLFLHNLRKPLFMNFDSLRLASK